MQSANQTATMVKFRIGISPCTILNGWVLLQVVQYFQPLVSVFVAAMLLAFVLDYPIQFLQRQGVKREPSCFGSFTIGCGDCSQL